MPIQLPQPTHLRGTKQRSSFQQPFTFKDMTDSAYNSSNSTLDSLCNEKSSSMHKIDCWVDKKACDNDLISLRRQHRSDTPSLKEYGECYRRLGEGTSAIVMVVRKLGRDGRSEKLYAIKLFRKRSKSESQKDYMKKLTSEFCISSTFSHPNVIQTIDLVLDDRKRYCTVMEYVSAHVYKFFVS